MLRSKDMSTKRQNKENILRNPRNIIFLILIVVLPILVLAINYAQDLRSKASSQSTLFGNALEILNEGFNNTYVSTANAPLAPNPLTVEAWVNYAAPTSGTYIRELPVITYTKTSRPADYGYLYRLNLTVQEQSGTANPTFSALLANSTSVINKHNNVVSTSLLDPSFSLSPNTWYHIAAVSYSEGNYCHLKLYIDGQLRAQGSRYRQNCTIATSDPRELRIGKPTDGSGGISGHYFTGRIDDLRISNVIRYSAPFSRPILPHNAATANTILLYPFNEFSGPTVADLSSSQKNGTITGSRFSFIPSTVLLVPTATPTPTPTPMTIQSCDIRSMCIGGGSPTLVDGQCVCPEQPPVELY